ncbi:MAG: hypothetical protein ABIH03_06185 [Pseudomonadota bacterium]
MSMQKTADLLVSVGVMPNRKKVYRRVGMEMTSTTTGMRVIKLELIPMPKMSKEGFPEVWIKVQPCAINAKEALGDKQQGDE